MNELDKLLQSTPIDELLDMDFSKFSVRERAYLHEKITEIADAKCFQFGIEYNVHDVELVRQLDDKMKFIEMVYALAYDAKVNFSDVFTQVRMWDVLIHNHLWEQKIAIPMATRSSKDGAYEGAYVKDPAIGMHEWVLSFDLTSLYPHLIMQYNIGPDTIQESPISLSVDTILDKNKPLPLRKDCSLAANGWYFSNAHQGFLAQMMERMYEDRAVYKKKMIESQKHLQALEEEAKKRGLTK